jgi:16S rRNA (guanine966-N2)-methyltransferase
LRIIAGKFRSRKIYSGHTSPSGHPKSEKSVYRPTTDRAKETLFNVLNNLIDFNLVKCLDLFAGSGALGFEALSRGAASCDFVDASSKQLQLIKKTSEDLEVENNINMLNCDAIDFLAENRDSDYDLIFADPPYDYSKYEILLQEIFLLKFSIFVLEHSSVINPLYDTNKFDVTSKTIGITNFKIFSSKE